MQRNYKYNQIIQLLTRRIIDQEYPPGTNMPSEHELMAEHGISRNTARHVLNGLQEMGMIRRQRGKRGIVTNSKIIDNVAKSSRVSEILAENKRFSYSKVISISLVEAPAQAAEFLGLCPGNPVVRIYRQRLADHLPLVINDTYLNPSPFGFLLNSNLENLSLNNYIQRTVGIQAGAARRDLEIITLTETEAGLLGRQPGDPAFLQTQYLWDSQGAPFYFNWSIYRADMVKFSFSSTGS